MGADFSKRSREQMSGSAAKRLICVVSPIERAPATAHDRLIDVLKRRPATNVARRRTNRGSSDGAVHLRGDRRAAGGDGGSGDLLPARARGPGAGRLLRARPNATAQGPPGRLLRDGAAR